MGQVGQAGQADNEASAAPPVADLRVVVALGSAGLRVVVALVSAGLRVAVDLPMGRADQNAPVAPNDLPRPT